MYNCFRKYLALNKKLSLPGIGTLVLEDIPARLDFANKTIHSPLSVIRFSSDSTSFNHQFLDFISQELQVDEEDAFRKVTAILKQLQSNLDSSGMVELPGIGSFQKAYEKNYSFHSALSFQEYFPEVVAERIIRSDSNHNVRVGEEDKSRNEMQEILANNVSLKDNSWWIFAIILAIVGIVAILYRYYQ